MQIDRNSEPVHRALRVASSIRRGSSWPIVVETTGGRFFTKLRGAAQGTSALTAEIIVAALADALGLRVPQRALIEIDEGLECADRHEELLELLAASRGINLGFQFLDGAREIRPNEIDSVDENLASQILWLDALVMNLDRTLRNSNILLWKKELWLIDHGASLPFQHNWSKVSEASPRSPRYQIERHLLAQRASLLDLWDERLAERITAEVLHHAVSQVPDCFLRPLLPPDATDDRLMRRRRAYEAFLWKRLKAPRPFTERWKLAHRKKASDSSIAFEMAIDNE
jgi:hypothetical protein